MTKTLPTSAQKVIVSYTEFDSLQHKGVIRFDVPELSSQGTLTPNHFFTFYAEQRLYQDIADGVQIERLRPSVDAIKSGLQKWMQKKINTCPALAAYMQDDLQDEIAAMRSPVLSFHKHSTKDIFFVHYKGYEENRANWATPAACDYITVFGRGRCPYHYIYTDPTTGRSYALPPHRFYDTVMNETDGEGVFMVTFRHRTAYLPVALHEKCKQDDRYSAALYQHEQEQSEANIWSVNRYPTPLPELPRFSSLYDYVANKFPEKNLPSLVAQSKRSQLFVNFFNKERQSNLFTKNLAKWMTYTILPALGWDGKLRALYPLFRTRMPISVALSFMNRLDRTMGPHRIDMLYRYRGFLAGVLRSEGDGRGVPELFIQLLEDVETYKSEKIMVSRLLYTKDETLFWDLSDIKSVVPAQTPEQLATITPRLRRLLQSFGVYSLNKLFAYARKHRLFIHTYYLETQESFKPYPNALSFIRFLATLRPEQLPWRKCRNFEIWFLLLIAHALHLPVPNNLRGALKKHFGSVKGLPVVDHEKLVGFTADYTAYLRRLNASASLTTDVVAVMADSLRFHDRAGEIVSFTTMLQQQQTDRAGEMLLLPALALPSVASTDRIVLLQNEEELVAEGATMAHCVGTYFWWYLSNTITNGTYIFSLQSGDKRSTLELRYKLQTLTDTNTSVYRFNEVQHQSFNNSEPDASCRALADTLISSLNAYYANPTCSNSLKEQLQYYAFQANRLAKAQTGYTLNKQSLTRLKRQFPMLKTLSSIQPMEDG